VAVSTYFREGKRSLISFRCASRSFLICASISSLRACPSLSTFDCKGVKVINARREEVEGVMDDGQGERLEEFKKGEGKWVGKDQSVRFPQEVRKAAFIPPPLSAGTPREGRRCPVDGSGSIAVLSCHTRSKCDMCSPNEAKVSPQAAPHYPLPSPSDFSPSPPVPSTSRSIENQTRKSKDSPDHNPSCLIESGSHLGLTLSLSIPTRRDRAILRLPS
jgi:hypothetical protein